MLWLHLGVGGTGFCHACIATRLVLLTVYGFEKQVLLERLRNEITRLTAVKAFASIAQSPLSLDLSPVMEPLLAELTGFLRKANRVLRQAALSAIEVTTACRA